MPTQDFGIEFVILGGGIGSAELLRASGCAAAGEGMAMDTTVMVYDLYPWHAWCNSCPARPVHDKE